MEIPNVKLPLWNTLKYLTLYTSYHFQKHYSIVNQVFKCSQTSQIAEPKPISQSPYNEPSGPVSFHPRACWWLHYISQRSALGFNKLDCWNYECETSTFVNLRIKQYSWLCYVLEGCVWTSLTSLLDFKQKSIGSVSEQTYLVT